MQKIRVLLRAENRLTHLALRQALSSAGKFDVVDENAAKPGLMSGPDVIVLGISRVDPAALRTIIDIFTTTRNPRIVVISSNSEIDSLRSLLDAGVLGYVLYQASDAELFFAIQSAYCNRHFIDPRLSNSVAEVLLRKRATLDVRKTNTVSCRGRLSRRESQVLRAIAQGFTGGEIAAQLCLSPRTVATYRGRICQKLQLKNRSQMVAYAIAAGELVGREKCS